MSRICFCFVHFLFELRGNGCSTRDQMELFNRRGSLVLMDAPTFSDTNSNALPAPSPGISHGSLDVFFKRFQCFFNIFYVLMLI